MPTIKNYEHYIPLIKSIVKNSSSYYLSKNINIYKIMDYEDFCQEMYFAYKKCTDTFNAQKSNFATYLTNQCKYKIQQMVRDNFGHTQTDLLTSDSLVEDSGSFYTLSEGEEFQTDRANTVMAFIKEDSCSELLVDKFINKLSLNELVKKYGLNKYTINQKIKRFKNKMIEYFKED